jgi:hypothetical protein
MQIVPQWFFTLVTETVRRGAKRETPPDRADGAMTRGLQICAPETHSGLIRDQAGFEQTSLNCCFVFFARANADDAFDVSHENLAVADLAGAGRTDDCVDDLIRL